MYNKRDKEDAVKEYVSIRSKHGDKAKSNAWMQKNNHSALVNYVGRHFNGWNEFKKSAGFNDSPLHVSWTPALAIKRYKEIRKEQGDRAKSSDWMTQNGHSKVVQFAINKFGTWSDFKKNAGFNDPPAFRTWDKNKAIEEYLKITGLPTDSIGREKFFKGIEKSSAKIKSSSWLAKNGHGALLSYVRNSFNSWADFKKQAGVKDK